MSGLDRSRVVNKDILELFGDYVNCFVCKMIVKEPYTCEDCEKSCCKGCFQSDFTCKNCKSKNLKFFPSVFKNFLHSLNLKCKNAWCNQVSPYNKIEEHEVYCFESLGHSQCPSENSFMKSFDKVEVSIENQEKPQSSFSKEIDIVKAEEIHKENLAQDLATEYVQKDLNDVQSMISENDDDKFSKISMNFIDSLNINSQQPEGDTNMKFVQNDNDKDSVINALAVRVQNLEKLCTSLITETSTLKNTLRCVHINTASQGYVNHQQMKLPNLTVNGNLEPHRGMIVFNTCGSCQKITNVKIQLKCDNCSVSVCPECYYNCEKCGTVSCKTCGKCASCKQLKYCYKCKFSCGQCVKNKNVFCGECIKSCEVCSQEDKFCKRCCAFKCKECQKISCLKCIWNCKSCYTSFCVNHPSEDCKLCGAKNCPGCWKKCFDCEKSVCLSCMVDCKDCGNKVCKKCYVTSQDNKKICRTCLKK